MQLDLAIQIENIWGKQDFKKSEWGPINYLVGPNGSGKSQFIGRLLDYLSQSKISYRYLSSDRLVSWSKQQSYITSALASGISFQWLPDFEIIKITGKRTGCICFVETISKFE